MKTQRNIALLGAPVGVGAGVPGCAMGPAAYRTLGLGDALEALGHRTEDLGDALCANVSHITSPTARLRNLIEIAGWTRSLHDWALRLGLSDQLPIYMGGDHALALGTVSGQTAAAAQQGREQFVLWLDAHADFNTFSTTESGNLHGTPLAYACGQSGFDELLGRPLEHTLKPNQVCILGLRSVDARERELVVSQGITVHDMRQIDERGVSRLLSDFLDQVIAANGLLHVSLDVDFLDPAIAPAVGTTVPGGATEREAHLIMEMLCDSGRVSSVDLVELNPMLDERGRTARVMVDLCASLFGRSVIDRRTQAW